VREVDRNVDTIPIPTRGRLAFMSKGMWDPMSGIPAADALCTQEATAAGKPGTFKALLGTSKASAISRFDTSGAPWVRVDGLPLLPSARDFPTALMLDVAPGVRLDGSVVPTIAVIPLGSNSTLGAVAPLTETCNDWSSATSASLVGFISSDARIAFASSGCTPVPVLCLQE
jgi:hypothetical protein